MSWYYAEGTTQKGPLSDEAFAALVQGGTIRPETLVWREGMANWQPCRTAAPGVGATIGAPAIPGAGEVVCSECGKTVPAADSLQLAGRTVCAACKPRVVQGMVEGTSSGPGAFNVADFLEGLRVRGGYHLQIGDSVSRGWDLVQANFWPCIGVNFLVLLASAVSSQIPCVGFIAAVILTGPLMGGLLLYFLLQARGGKATIDDAFSGFRQPRFVNLMLTSLVVQGVPMLVMMVVFLPVYFGVLTAALDPAGVEAAGPPPILVGVMVLMVPVGLALMYFGLITYPAYIIVADTGLKFWDGIKLSIRLVHMRFGSWILFAICCALISMVGVLALCIGLLLAMPVINAAMAWVWIDIRRTAEEGKTSLWRGTAA